MAQWVKVIASENGKSVGLAEPTGWENRLLSSLSSAGISSVNTLKIENMGYCIFYKEMIKNDAPNPNTLGHTLLVFEYFLPRIHPLTAFCFFNPLKS